MLSLRELERAARILDRRCRDARIEKIVQAEPHGLVLSLYGHDPESGAGEKRHLHLSVRPDFARVGELGRPPRAPDTPPAFAQLLRKRLDGGRLRGAELWDGDRQLALRIETRAGRFVLLLSILGKRSNLYLLDGEKALVRALRPLDETRPELALGEPWQPPRRPPRDAGEDRWAELDDADFLAAAERHYAESEEDRAGADLQRRLGVALQKERKQVVRRLEKLESELAEADEAGVLQRRGELLKTALGRVEPGASSVQATDFETDETVEIPLDAALTPKQNLEALFKRYHKLLRRLTKAGGQVDAVRTRLAELEAHEATLAEAGDDAERLEALAADSEVAALLRRHAPAQKPKGPSPRRTDTAPIGPFKDVPRRLHPRRYRSRDGLEIWVGRSDDANDFLSTRLARGNDLFFHLDGAPGSHVVLRTEGRTDPPQESLLDAAELAVQFSKARRAGRADVHVVPIKQVKKPKGAKPGLVYVTGGRTLHLRREEARLRRLLGSRVDED